MVEMQKLKQAITQATLRATRAVAKAITDVADPVEGSTGRNERGNVDLKVGGPHLK